MQAFFANFPNKLTLNFPQNIVHQIFHEMSNILYIPDFPDFPVNGFFRRFSAAVQDPQIFQIFQTAEIFRRFSASSFPDFPLYRIRQIFRRFFRLPDFPQIFPLARFSASPPACQVFRTKKGLETFQSCPITLDIL